MTDNHFVYWCDWKSTTFVWQRRCSILKPSIFRLDNMFTSVVGRFATVRIIQLRKLCLIKKALEQIHSKSGCTTCIIVHHHTSVEFLDLNYANRWTGIKGPQQWPPRSSDFNTLDLFSWEHLISLVYKSKIKFVREIIGNLKMRCQYPNHFHCQKIERIFN